MKEYQYQLLYLVELLQKKKKKKKKKKKIKDIIIYNNILFLIIITICFVYLKIKRKENFISSYC